MPVDDYNYLRQISRHDLLEQAVQTGHIVTTALLMADEKSSKVDPLKLQALGAQVERKAVEIIVNLLKEFKS